jgi:NodT family efflux transporter outer membrane factor (OMF) lipoprotein
MDRGLQSAGASADGKGQHAWRRVPGRATATGSLAGVVYGFVCVAMLAACSLTSERSELALDVPDSYRAGHGDTARPALDWWRGFRSAELTALIENAQTDNFDIAAAIGRIVQADAQSRIAGAPLLPTLDLNASANRSRPSATLTSSGSFSGAVDRNIFTTALNASYEIDFWGKNLAASRAAQENAVATRFNKEVVVLSTVVSVGTAYFQVLSAQDRLRIARENLASATRILNLINERFKAGTASDLDVSQQQSVVDTQRASIPPLDQTVRQNMAALAVLVGRAPADLKVRGGSLNRLGIPRVTPGLPSELLFQRPDIRAAEANLASADASVDSARAAFFPSITLTGQGGRQSAVFQLLFSPQSAFYQIAANLAQPVFDGFRLQGQLEQAQGRQLELLEMYRKTVVQAFADVESGLIAVQDAAERERLQQRVVDSSRRAFDVAETRLREGTVDLVTVLQTQQTLYQAQDTLAQARLARFQAVLSLFQALGGSWLPPPVVVDAAETQ